MPARLSLFLLSLLAAGCGVVEEKPGGSETAASLPAVARIVCDGRTTEVATPRVRARPDGVHITVRNETTQVEFSALDRFGAGPGDGVPPGTASFVWPLHPGIGFVRCTRYDEDPSEVPGVPLEIVDADGVWVSTDLSQKCRTASTFSADYVEGAGGERGTPVDVGRRHFARAGLEPGDVVEEAGYLADEEVEVRLVRDGEVIAVAKLVDDGAGGWLVPELTRCESG